MVQGGEWPRFSARPDYNQAVHGRAVCPLPNFAVPGVDYPGIGPELCNGRIHPRGDSYLVVCEVTLLQPLRRPLGYAGRTPQEVADGSREGVDGAVYRDGDTGHLQLVEGGGTSPYGISGQKTRGGREKRGTGERAPTPGRTILRGRRHDSVVRPPVAPVGVYDTSGTI